MSPRFVFRTHYQVSEPAYVEFLIKLCTSPVQSSYREVVAKKLAVQIEKRCKTDGARGEGIRGFNEKAGEYAVDLARALELITPNHGWTGKGHLVNLIANVDETSPAEEVELNSAERLLHFRVFLEGDGAAFLFLGKYFLDHRSIQNIHSPDTVNPLAQEMFIEVLKEYYALAVEPTERLTLRRHLESVRAKPFRGKGGTHKIKLHIQTLYRLGLLNSDGSSYELSKKNQGSSVSGLEMLLRRIPNIPSLEKNIRQNQWLEIAADVFNLGLRRTESTEDILPTIASYYRRVMESGTPLASLQTLIEATRIKIATDHMQIISYELVESAILKAQKQNPKDLRFHVDRLGRPAFLKMSSRFAGSLAADKAVA